jgi:2-methylisocitrate lyase-like PEP mutase family enzyme
MTETSAAAFLALHRPGDPLVMPNPWDAGSARMLAALGFAALATTSSGYALTLGRSDGSVSRDEALVHATAVAAAVSVPVNADLEDAFAASPEEVAATMARVPATGVAGASLEDWHAGAILPMDQASERVAAAREALGAEVVLTARAENFLRGNPDLADTIARLQAYAAAGADVLYAPFLTSADDILAIVSSVDKPVNVLLTQATPTVPALAELGVARVSIGGAFAYAAYGSLVGLAEQLRGPGPYAYFADVARGGELAGRAIATT